MNRIQINSKYLAILVAALIISSLFSGCLWIGTPVIGPVDEEEEPFEPPLKTRKMRPDGFRKNGSACNEN